MEIISKFFTMKKLEKSNMKKHIIKTTNNRTYINAKNNLLLTIIFIMIVFFPTCLSKQIEFRKLASSYEISITIKGTGNQYILSENCEIDGESYVFNSLPNSIKINDVNQGSIVKSYNLEGETNTIKMTWSLYTSSFKAMFCGLSNIINIQFNYIATSIKDVSYMFNGCNNLESIDFGNFDNINVIDMRYMFAGCSKLETLNLSLFSTYKVKNMNSMFK